YLALTDAYGWTSGSLSEQELGYQQALRRAAALEDRLPGRERALVRARLGRETGSATSYAGLRQAIERYPDAAQLWYELGEHYFHDPRVMGNPAQIEDAFRQAAELQPAITPLRIHL